MKVPKVTVLMSVYNGEQFLREAVDSILSQKFEDFEFLIINDGSNDGTKEILESYRDPRIRLIENDKNIGLTKSLNKGINMSNGQYIARMDADDVSIPDRFEKQVNFLNENNEVGLVGTYYLMINEKGNVLHEVRPLTDRRELKEKLLTTNQFGHGTVMFRRECLGKSGLYREEFKSSQDYDLWLRISEMYDIANIPEPLYKWRVNPGAISVNRKTMQDKYACLAVMMAKERRQNGEDRLQTMSEKEIDSFIDNAIPGFSSQSKKEIAQNYYFWATVLFGGKDYRGALKLIWRSVINNPLYRRSWLLFTACLILTLLPRPLIDVLRSIKLRFQRNQVNDSTGETGER